MSKVIDESIKLVMGWNNKQLEIYKKIGAIVVAMNDIGIEDLVKMTQEISRDETIGPFIDPTAWRDGKFEDARMVKTVVRAIVDFKKAVNGIGRFNNV